MHYKQWRFKRFVGPALSVAMLFAGAANAIQIPDYDKMAPDDRANYMVSLVMGAAKGLEDHQQHDQSVKLIAFFKDPSDKGGASQFKRNLQAVRIINQKNAADPNNKQAAYEIEDALRITLSDNNINVPDSFLLQINKDFKPSKKAAATTQQSTPATKPATTTSPTPAN